MKKVMMALAMLSLSATMTFAQDGFGFISASLTCRANSNGNGLVVTGGRVCANAFSSTGLGGICFDAATILNGYTVENIVAGNASQVTYSGLTANNLSTANIPCETVVAAMSQFLVFGGGFAGPNSQSDNKTQYGFCNANKIVFGYGEGDRVEVKLEPSSTIQLANNTIVSQWTGACFGFGGNEPNSSK